MRNFLGCLSNIENSAFKTQKNKRYNMTFRHHLVLYQMEILTRSVQMYIDAFEARVFCTLLGVLCN